MRTSFLTTLVAILTTIHALPSASTLHALSIATSESEFCQAPDLGHNCAGAPLKDVIIQYGNATPDQRKLVQDVVKSSGSEIVFDYRDFGFSGLIPGPVVEVLKASGETLGVKVTENACAGIPWCGEAPC